MSVPELIRKKRDGEELSDQEVSTFVRSIVDGSAQDCQLGAMLMAMFLRGMSDKETASLTRHMALSGDVLAWDPDWEHLLVDKHSTGGVGDKVSLCLAPALAALGFKVPMVSGRGLAFTGGTLDKLESIPGFKVQCEVPELERALREAGCFISGATGSLAPADKELYQRRDVTSTVDSTPLVVASIVSKKVAEGTRALVMDIKVGKAAFYRDVESARTLAHKLINVAKGLELPTRVALTRMDVPIGCAVGNALEVAESIDYLKGKGPKDLVNLVETLGAMVLQMKGHTPSLDEGRKAVHDVIESGAALDRFHKMLVCQGVAEHVANKLCAGDPWSVLPQAEVKTTLAARCSGVVVDVDAMAVADACWKLGAGRSRADQSVDHRVGVWLLKTVGDTVREGEPLIQVHHANLAIDDIFKQLESAIFVVDVLQEYPPSPIIEII